MKLKLANILDNRFYVAIFYSKLKFELHNSSEQDFLSFAQYCKTR